MCGFHIVFKYDMNFAFECFLLPSQMDWGFFRIHKQNRHCSKCILTTCIDFSDDFLFPLFINCVSSANWEIVCPTLLIYIPFISSSSRIIMANISTHIMNKCREIGSPCLHPRCILNHWVICPQLYYDCCFYICVKGLYPSTHIVSKTKDLRTLNIHCP